MHPRSSRNRMALGAVALAAGLVLAGEASARRGPGRPGFSLEDQIAKLELPAETEAAVKKVLDEARPPGAGAPGSGSAGRTLRYGRVETRSARSAERRTLPASSRSGVATNSKLRGSVKRASREARCARCSGSSAGSASTSAWMR